MIEFRFDLLILNNRAEGIAFSNVATMVFSHVFHELSLNGTKQLITIDQLWSMMVNIPTDVMVLGAPYAYHGAELRQHI